MCAERAQSNRSFCQLLHVLGRPAARGQNGARRGYGTFDKTVGRHSEVDLEHFPTPGAPINGELKALVPYPTNKHIIPAFAQLVKGRLTVSVCSQARGTRSVEVRANWRNNDDCLGQRVTRFINVANYDRERTRNSNRRVARPLHDGDGTAASARSRSLTKRDACCREDDGERGCGANTAGHCE